MPGYEVVVLLDADNEATARMEVVHKLCESENLFNIEVYRVEEIPDEE